MSQERKSGATRAALQPGLSALADLFDDERGEEVAVAV